LSLIHGCFGRIYIVYFLIVHWELLARFVKAYMILINQ
jgi:hypothetical protein